MNVIRPAGDTKIEEQPERSASEIARVPCLYLCFCSLPFTSLSSSCLVFKASLEHCSDMFLPVYSSLQHRLGAPEFSCKWLLEAAAAGEETRGAGVCAPSVTC
ncbi:hypothetical protein EYF80_014662 [Liparis tanakae]|uniref:Uncharacterized protein n=1 Tax=Liparis tanakae TaxID=230148 RepID=A0A4Z2IAJ2_9TELE|nr:hypothetical protein EYF80_014662 [Liparis tanakae]